MPHAQKAMAASAAYSNPGQVSRAKALAISAAGESGSNGGGAVRRSKAARAAELKVSQVQTTKATSNEIAIRTDDRLGGRRTITASSWQQRPNSGCCGSQSIASFGGVPSAARAEIRHG